MSHLLDSDLVIDFLAGQHSTGLLIADLAKDGIAISVVTYVEVLEGILAGHNAKPRQRVFRRFLKHVRVLAIGRPIADRTVEIRIDLRRQKCKIDERALDILIAATAIEHNLTLVTRNTRHYADITGLKLRGPT